MTTYMIQTVASCHVARSFFLLWFIVIDQLILFVLQFDSVRNWIFYLYFDNFWCDFGRFKYFFLNFRTHTPKQKSKNHQSKKSHHICSIVHYKANKTKWGCSSDIIEGEKNWDVYLAFLHHTLNSTQRESQTVSDVSWVWNKNIFIGSFSCLLSVDLAQCKKNRHTGGVYHCSKWNCKLFFLHW